MPPPTSPIPKTSHQGSDATARSAGLPFTLVARFSRQMKPHRLYPLVVHLRQNKRQRDEGNIGTLHLRPVIPGAIVTPADYTLDLDHPDTNPPFFVTPLAKGTLRNARMEVFQQGRLVGTIALPMKAVRQTFTWFLLFLTIVVPFSTYWLARHTNLTREGATIESRTTDDDQVPQLPDDRAVKKSNEEGVNEKAPATFTKLPKFEGGVERSMARALPDAPISQTVASTAQDVYQFVHSGPDFNLTFYLAAMLLGLTCISWAMHTTRSCRRKVRPVERGVSS